MRVGDKVTWRSQAQGRSKMKAGEIVAVVPAGQRPDREQFLRLYRGAGVGFPRDHESYVVLVGNKPYWPRVGHLRCTEPASAEGAVAKG